MLCRAALDSPRRGVHCRSQDIPLKRRLTEETTVCVSAPSPLLNGFSPLSSAVRCLHLAHFGFNDYQSGMDVPHVSEQRSEG